MLTFRIHRRTEDLREDYLENLAENALVLGRGPMTAKDINRSLAETYSIHQLPESLLEDCLQKLVDQVRVIRQDGTYRLAEERARMLDQEAKSNLSAYEGMLEQLISRVEQTYGKKLTPEQAQLSKEVTYNVFWELFESSGIIAGRTLYSYRPHECWVPARLVVTELKDSFEHFLSIVHEEPLKEALREAIPSLLHELDPTLQKLLYRTLQNYIYFEVSDLDPEVKSLERAYLERRVGYVDTNFALDLLLPARERNKIALETANLCRQLGIKLTMSSRTLEELSAHISGSLQATQRYGIQKYLPELVRYDDEGFTRSFCQEKARNPSLTPEGYLLSLEKDFRMKLREFGVEFDQQDHADLSKVTELEDFRKSVSECADLHMLLKNREMIEHDAFHLLLIRDMRRSSKLNLFGPREWFVTNDKSLYCVSERLAEAGETQFPLTVLTEIWLHSLFPFLPIKSLEEKASEVGKAFTEFCGSRLGASLPEIPFGTLLRIIGPWTKFEIFDIEELVRIGREIYVQTYFMEPHESLEITARTMISDRLGEKIDKVREEARQAKEELKAITSTKQEFESKYQQAVTEVTQLKQMLETTSSKLGQLESKPGPIHLFLLGFLCILLIPTVWLLSAWKELAVPDSVYHVLAVLSAVFCISSAIKEARESISHVLSGWLKPAR